MTHSPAHTEPSQDSEETDLQRTSGSYGWCMARFPGNAAPKFYTTDRRIADGNDTTRFVVKPWTGTSALSAPLEFRRVDKTQFSGIAHTWPFYQTCMPAASTMYKDYLAQFAEYQKAFAKGALRKAILSRIKMVGKPDGFEAKALFEKLCQKYPKAFVYLLSHPSFGLWMGASPELLLKKNAAQWQTVSLAGTKPINGHDRPWTSKELEEQEMVSMHVREALKKAGAENLREHGPKTVSAGAVSHLQTIFDFDLGPASVKPLSLLDELHPTPAVAGLPVAAATALIARTEQHPRGLYTGYLGEVGADGTSELYVNLRCMQIGGSQIALYAGGGITAASNPEAEWEETEHKALTLHQELNERV